MQNQGFKPRSPKKKKKKLTQHFNKDEQYFMLIIIGKQLFIFVLSCMLIRFTAVRRNPTFTISVTIGTRSNGEDLNQIFEYLKN